MNIQSTLLSNVQVQNSRKLKKIYSILDKLEIGSCELANTSDIDAIYLKSKESLEAWKNTPIYEKSKLFKKIAEELVLQKDKIAEIMAHEIGKGIKAASDEVERSAEYIQATIEISKTTLNGEMMRGDLIANYKYNQKTAFVERIPYGVALCISPFNYPINLAISKIVPALMAGNTVVFKPATQGCLSAYIMAEILYKILPQGVFHFVTGNGFEIGDYLYKHNLVDLINFTGSTKIGDDIMVNSQLSGKYKKIILELGGKDTALVTKNADIELAAEQIIKGAFSYNGQRCTAVKRVFVDMNSSDLLLNKLKEKLDKLSIGSPLENKQITPLISNEASEYIESLVNEPDFAHEFIYYPNEYKFKRNVKNECLIRDVDKNIINPILAVSRSMLDELQQWKSLPKLLTEEQFGPILPIFIYKNIDSALNFINSSKYALQSSIFTNDINEAFNLANKINTGTVQINGKPDRGPDNFPFGGFAGSGFSTQGIADNLLEMTKKKVVVLNL